MDRNQYLGKLENFVDKFNEYSERARIRGSPHSNMQGWNVVATLWYMLRIELLNSRASYSGLEIPPLDKDENGKFYIRTN